MSQYREFIGQVVRALPDEENFDEGVMQEWITNPEKLRRALQRSLLEVVPPQFSTWRTITLGAHESVEDLFAALEQNDNMEPDVAEWTGDLLRQAPFRVADEVISLALVKTTVEKLGFPDGATWQNIFRRARGQGLRLCPPEVGLQLRLQYPDQPKGEWLTIAMEPIEDSDGDLMLFDVAHGDKGQLFGSHWACPDDPTELWSPKAVFVFVSS